MSDVIAGRQPVLEALRSGRPVEQVVLLHGIKGSLTERIRTLAEKRGVRVTEVDRKQFRRFSGEATAQGVVALVAEYSYAGIDEILAIAEGRGEPPLLMVLDEIEDPHNLGALIRTAECAGAHGVIIPKHHSASVNQTVAKASSGASLHLPTARVANIAQTLEDLKRRGLWIIGADIAGDRLYYDADYAGPAAIVIGSEGKGMRRLVREKCDVLVRIPLFGKVESLNASVAGALILYEAARARRKL